jgi:hypothetical protein
MAAEKHFAGGVARVGRARFGFITCAIGSEAVAEAAVTSATAKLYHSAKA